MRTLKIWLQNGPDAPGRLVDYTLNHVSSHMSFLEMLDRFHETYPQVGLHMMLHFEHPDRDES